MLNYHNQLRLGTSRSNIGAQHAWPLNGDIAEIIIFNKVLNNAERIIIENYLSSKYNLPTANDYYINNLSDYTYDVQGIGTTDGTVQNKHSYSASSKELSLEELNGSFDSANEFVFAGHGSVDNNYIATDLPLGIEKRWSRIWYVEKSIGSSAAISLSFNVSQVKGIEQTKEYCLLFREENSGNFSPIKAEGMILHPTIKGDVVSFTLSSDQLNVGNLINGYYTLGVKPAESNEALGKHYHVVHSARQSSSFVNVKKELTFYYNEEYRSNVLTYSIYNYKGTPLSNLPTLTKAYGENFFSVDLSNKGLVAGGVYTLELRGEKKEKSYLKFRYEE